MNGFLDIHLTHTQLFICCAVVMFFCFTGIVCLAIKFLLKAISMADADIKNKQKQKTHEKISLKKAFWLFFSVWGVFSVVDWYADHFPDAVDVSAKLGVSSSLFFLLAACVGLFLVIFYIPYKVLKFIFANATTEQTENKKTENKRMKNDI